MYTFDVNGRITDPDANEGTTVDSIMAPNSMISSTVHYDYALDETDATSEETQYTYNGSQLTRMVVKTTTTQSDGSSTTTTKTLYFSYDASGTPLSVNYDGTDYYYVTNLQGDIVAILNSSGTAVVQYTYDARGNILSTTGSMKLSLGLYNPLRYRGYVFDTDSRLYYLQSRYYNPETGRFINGDALISTGQGILGNNMFAYCLNDPTNCLDPTGNSSHALRRDPTQISYEHWGGGGGGAIIAGSITLSALVTSAAQALVDIVGVVADTIEETAQQLIAWVEALAGETSWRNHSVYVLKDSNNLVRYIGRTNNPSRRGWQHKHDLLHPWRADYNMIVVATGLTLQEAMVLEQALISAYTIKYLENARREIAINNVPMYRAYLNAATEIVVGIPAGDIYELIKGR